MATGDTFTAMIDSQYSPQACSEVGPKTCLTSAMEPDERFLEGQAATR